MKGYTNETRNPYSTITDVEWIWACKIVIVVVGLIGNLLVIATVLSSKQLRSRSTFVLICSLSIVVLYALIAVIPFDINATLIGDWPDHLHPKLCAFNAVSAMFFYGSTALNTAMIALERYFATVWYGNAAVNSRATLGVMLAVCYLVPLLSLTPFFAHVHSGFDPMSMSCFVTGEWKYDRFVWTVTMLAVSTLLMAYCFVHIFVDLCRRKHTLLATDDDQGQTPSVGSSDTSRLRGYFSELKTVKVAVVLFLLILLRLPSLMAPKLATKTTLFVTMNSTLIVALAAIMFYPFVYVLFSREFRQASADLVCCWCRQRGSRGGGKRKVPTDEVDFARHTDTHV